MKLLLLFILFLQVSLHAEKNPFLYKEQSPVITSLLKKDRSVKHTKELISIINRIDETYGDLHDKLTNGKKITIFFDPAHGKLASGTWQGAVTGRLSCTNRPEEYYSVIISRKLYQFLANNPFIDVCSTDDYLAVLKGEQDTYKNIPFKKTVRLAQKHNAFIILSEHLNNVASHHKAGGILNSPGLHAVINHRGRYVLRHIEGTYKGFLTLYNQLDATGFSKNYAIKLKRMLMQQGLSPNSWEFGAVGDDRFSYFVDFPISIIYESGFISNPEEEKKFRDPEFVENIARIQYKAFIENVKAIFSVDISGFIPLKTNKPVQSRIELLKLARIAVYYIKKGDTRRGINVIKKIESRYKKTIYKNYIEYFSEIKNRLLTSEKYYGWGLQNRRKKRYLTARRYFRKAQWNLNKAPIYYSYHKKYAAARGISFRPEMLNTSSIITEPRDLPVTVTRAPLKRKIIVAVDTKQGLRQALVNALNPDSATLDVLEESFKKATVVEWKRRKKYSSKKRKTIWYWKKINKKVDFSSGIYIVKINNKLQVVAAKKVSSVTLDPKKYQNEQFLKNSHFGPLEKHKAL